MNHAPCCANFCQRLSVGRGIKMKGIVLKPLFEEDIPLFERWLDKDYIYKRLCPDGEEQRKAWLDEVANKDGKYDFLTQGMTNMPFLSIYQKLIYNVATSYGSRIDSSSGLKYKSNAFKTDTENYRIFVVYV